MTGEVFRVGLTCWDECWDCGGIQTVVACGDGDGSGIALWECQQCGAVVALADWREPAQAAAGTVPRAIVRVPGAPDPRPPTATLYAWKFWVPQWTADPEREGVEWKNCMAASIAATEEEAMDVIRAYAAERGYDVGWLPIAKVARLEITPRTFINIVMF